MFKEKHSRTAALTGEKNPVHRVESDEMYKIWWYILLWTIKRKKKEKNPVGKGYLFHLFMLWKYASFEAEIVKIANLAYCQKMEMFVRIVAPPEEIGWTLTQIYKNLQRINYYLLCGTNVWFFFISWDIVNNCAHCAIVALFWRLKLANFH